MAEFLPPSMPEPTEGSASQRSGEEQYAQAAAPPARSELPKQITIVTVPVPRSRPGALGRLISLVVSVGLAWALAIAITAWLLGLFLARG